MHSISILVADDHELVRKGLISILAESHPEWKVVAEASNGTEAIERGESLRPDLAILDISMPDPNGLMVAERLMTSVPAMKILILTMHSAAPLLRQMKKAGVSAYVVKNEAPKMLVKAVERILNGEPFFASSSASRPVDQLESSEYIPAPFLLTPRELEVMRLLALGKSNKELANDLGMSVRTAESHHASVLAKLNVNSIGEMVRVAIRDNVI
jgi:two-component system, NarL family, response regulator NreC